MANKEEFELEEDNTPSYFTFKNMALLIVLELSYLVLGPVLGLASLGLSWGTPTVGQVVVLLFKGAAAYIVTHVVLVGPIAQFAKRDLEKISSSILRLSLLSLLLSLPLFSFGFYMGRFQSWMDIHELVMAVLPPCIVGAFLFDAEKNAWRLSFMVSVPIFIAFFVANDLLGPFSVPVSYAVHHPYLLVVKTFVLVASIVVAAFLTRDTHREKKADALFAVSFLILLLFGVQEGLRTQIDPKGLFTLVPLDYTWMLFLLVGMISRVPTKFFSRVAVGASSLVLGFMLYRVGRFLGEGDVSLLQLSWLFTSLLGVAALVSFTIRGIKSFRLNS